MEKEEQLNQSWIMWNIYKGSIICTNIDHMDMPLLLFFISLSYCIQATALSTPSKFCSFSEWHYMNRLVSSSVLTSVGIVDFPSMICYFAQLYFSCRLLLLRSTFKDHSKFYIVYSCPQNIFVFFGREAILSIFCSISAAFPSKNLPQPLLKRVSPVKRTFEYTS